MNHAAAGCGVRPEEEKVSQAAPMPSTPVAFAVPAGACDCHVHVIPDPALFPFAADRLYAPPMATAAELLALHRMLHLDNPAQLYRLGLAR
jgi:hypothetical protein